MALATFNSFVRKGNPFQGTSLVSPAGRARPTFHLAARRIAARGRPRLWSGYLGRVLGGVLVLLGLICCGGATTDPVSSAREAYDHAKLENISHQSDPTSAWKFARATFDLADILPGNSERARIAEEGIAACHQALEHAPECAPLHYYLGLNQGELARTKTLGALRLVDQMEREFTEAIKLDPLFDYAGAERSLGLLYRDAPVLASIGSKSKARTHLQRAIELAPGYPENRLNLVESDLKWGDRKGARRDLKPLEDGWSAAKAKFSGAQWAASWEDWAARLDKVRKSLDEPARLETPRH